VKQSAGKGERKMPQNWTIEEWDAFHEFTDNVNPQSSHPLDEQRWRNFVIVSHKKKSQLTRSDVESALNGIGKLTQSAGIWADRYDDERKLLDKYDVVGGEKV
jgi:hypothetical protein